MKNACLLFLAVLLAQCGLTAKPVTLTVASTNDDISTSPLTLRGAVVTADNDTNANHFPYTILVPPGTYLLTNGALAIGEGLDFLGLYGYGSNVIIRGTGTAADTIVDQTSGSNRVFILDPSGYGNGTFAFANLTIKGGSDTYFDPFGLQGGGGGGISVLTDNEYIEIDEDFSDSLSITNCIFADNTATNGGDGIIEVQGGAAISTFGANLTLVGCVFSNNTLQSSYTNGFYGGAVLFIGYGDGYALTATGCSFENNGINGHANQSALGGALAVNCFYGYCNANITNCDFIRNSVTGKFSGSNAYGGGGAIFLGEGSAGNIIGCSFSSNQANGAMNLGGAILCNDDSSNFIKYCSFLDDSAADGGEGSEICLTAPPGPFKANNNWWGSDNGPATNAIFGATNTLAKAPTTWLFLTNTASPSAVAVGYNSTLTASFLTNSAGDTIDATNLSALTNVPISFSASNGSISSAQGVVQSSGTATAIFTGTNAGDGFGSATVAGETSNAGILVTASAGPSMVALTNVALSNATVAVTGVPFLTYRVLASEDLFSWSQLGSVLMPASGSSNYVDTNALSYPHRYYELVYP